MPSRTAPTISYSPPVKPVPSPGYVPKELEEREPEPETFEETPAAEEAFEPPKPEPKPVFEAPRVERPSPAPEKVTAPEPFRPPVADAPKAEEPPARQPEPAKPAEPQAANITMDSYVSDILGKYLKK